MPSPTALMLKLPNKVMETAYPFPLQLAGNKGWAEAEQPAQKEGWAEAEQPAQKEGWAEDEHHLCRIGEGTFQYVSRIGRLGHCIATFTWTC